MPSVSKHLACAATLIFISNKKVRKITTFFPFLQIISRFFAFFRKLSCVFHKKAVPLRTISFCLT